MDDLGRTSHPGSPRDLVKWRLEGSSSRVLGGETHAQHPSGHGARRSTGATGGIAHGSEAITPSGYFSWLRRLGSACGLRMAHSASYRLACTLPDSVLQLTA